MLHVIWKPRHKSWPTTAYIAIGMWPQSSRIDVSSMAKLRDQLQYYLGNSTQHLLVHITMGSVIGC